MTSSLLKLVLPSLSQLAGPNTPMAAFRHSSGATLVLELEDDRGSFFRTYFNFVNISWIGWRSVLLHTPSTTH